MSDAVSVKVLSEATTIEVDPQSMISQTSYSNSGVQGGSGLAIPSLPAGSTYGTPFRCPYCFFIVNVTNQNKWAQHMFSDLKPYVCVLPDCQTPNLLYMCCREWYGHMQDEHMINLSDGEVSKCLLCECDATPGEVLAKPLARHLEELALFALHRAGVVDQEILSVSLPDADTLRGIERLSITT